MNYQQPGMGSQLGHNMMASSYLNNMNPNLGGDYNRQSQYSNLNPNVHMQSVRESQVPIPRNVSVNAISQNAYTQDLRQSIMEVERSKNAIQKEYYSLMATGPERFLTADDLEEVINTLKDENSRLLAAEDDCKALRIEKEKLAQMLPKYERVKNTLEKQFIANDIRKNHNLSAMRQRELDLEAESRRLVEKLSKENLELDEFQRSFKRLAIDEVDREKRDDNSMLIPEINDMEAEYIQKLQTRKAIIEILERKEEELHVVKNDNTALALHLDSLVAHIRNNQIVATSGVNLEDDELRSLKLLKDNMMLKLDMKEKENDMLVVKIQKQNWNSNKVRMEGAIHPTALENVRSDLMRNSIVNREAGSVGHANGRMGGSVNFSKAPPTVVQSYTHQQGGSHHLSQSQNMVEHVGPQNLGVWDNPHGFADQPREMEKERANIDWNQVPEQRVSQPGGDIRMTTSRIVEPQYQAAPQRTETVRQKAPVETRDSRPKV
jgi:hypothetical protein